MVTHRTPGNKKHSSVGRREEENFVKFLKVNEEPNVLSSKASGPTDPEVCKTTRRKWWMIIIDDCFAGNGGTPLPT